MHIKGLNPYWEYKEINLNYIQFARAYITDSKTSEKVFGKSMNIISILNDAIK